MGKTSDTDHILDRKAKLKKVMKVKFTLGNSQEMKPANLIWKFGKLQENTKMHGIAS